MRTTITIDPDVETLLRQAMAERGVGMKQAVNDALRQGLGSNAAPKRYRLVPVDMGKPYGPLEKALRIAADMEDEAIVDKLDQRR